MNHWCEEIEKENKNMDFIYNAVYGFCAILTLLGLFIVLFTYFLCQLRNTEYTSQADNLDNTQVLIHQCEEGSGKCYTGIPRFPRFRFPQFLIYCVL